MSKRSKVSNFDELRKNLSGYTDQHIKEKAAARIDKEFKKTVTLNNDTKAQIEEIKTLINNEIDHLKHTINYLNKNEFKKAWNAYTISLNNHQKAIIKQMENHLYIHSEVDDHEFENERFTSQFEERNEHHLVFILPQMLSINLGDRGFYNAKLIAYLSRKLISEYALKKGELSYFKNPVILFEHHVKNSSFNSITVYMILTILIQKNCR